MLFINVSSSAWAIIFQAILKFVRRYSALQLFDHLQLTHTHHSFHFKPLKSYMGIMHEHCDKFVQELIAANGPVAVLNKVRE